MYYLSPISILLAPICHTLRRVMCLCSHWQSAPFLFVFLIKFQFIILRSCLSLFAKLICFSLPLLFSFFLLLCYVILMFRYAWKRQIASCDEVMSSYSTSPTQPETCAYQSYQDWSLISSKLWAYRAFVSHFHLIYQPKTWHLSPNVKIAHRMVA